MYMGKRRNEMPPHLFAASDEAYRNMIEGMTSSVVLLPFRCCTLYDILVHLL